MQPEINQFGQPIGFPLADWQPPPRPERKPMVGQHCLVQPLDVAGHASSLFDAFALEPSGKQWTYLPYGPFADEAAFTDWMRAMSATDDPLMFAIVCRQSSRAVGVAGYMRIQPQIGSIEVGHIHYSRLLSGTAAAAEAMQLMKRYVFQLGYRRYEWKCDALNERSRQAALRYGFQLEGIFRQATIYKGRNRDTAWYSIIDRDFTIETRSVSEGEPCS